MLHGDSATHDPPFLCYTAVFQPTPAVLMLHDAFSISTRRPRATRRCCRLCPEIIRATRSSFHLYPPHPRYAAIQPLVSHSTRCVVSDPYCTGASGRILYAIQTVEIMTTSYLDCSLTSISRSGIQSSLPDAKTTHEHQNAQGGSRHHGRARGKPAFAASAVSFHHNPTSADRQVAAATAKNGLRISHAVA